MRNIFDQYSQPENRVTHALMTALDRDRSLLKAFLHDIVGISPPTAPDRLELLEQSYPGENEAGDEQEADRRGIPDGWIFDADQGWCVVIESKVLMDLGRDQIERHRRTAGRRGFSSVTVLTLTPRRPSFAAPPDTRMMEWRNVYAWLHQHGSSHPWAAAAEQYLETAEAKLIATGQFTEGTLTSFAGIPFGLDRPFTYLEGKRVLGLALTELRQSRKLQRDLGMNPDLPGRPAITGKDGEAVWDFLSIADAGDGAFTNFPHLTLGIGRTVDAMVTVPNAVNRNMARHLRNLGIDGFRDLAHQIVRNLSGLLERNPGGRPTFRGVQRRYRSQRAKPEYDATIDFDLRTALPGAGPPKLQPRWLDAAFGALVEKGGTNYQIQMGVVFDYGRSAGLDTPGAIKQIEQAWLACRPLVDLARRIKS